MSSGGDPLFDSRPGAVGAKGGTDGLSLGGGRGGGD